MTDELLEHLRNVGCDREPFTPEHARCICHLADMAARRIERLSELVLCLVKNDPNADAVDAVTVLDVWRKDARAALGLN